MSVARRVPESMGALWIAVAFGMAPGSLVAQRPTFSARVDTVRVDVLVTADGRPVSGLQPADFEVSDNGVRQQVELLTFEQIPVNAVLVLDMSGSVVGERLQHLREAGRALLDGLKPDDKAALLTFSQSVSLRAELTTNIARVRAGLGQDQSFGATALRDATFAGLVTGQAEAGRPLIVAFSDGIDTASWLSSEAVLEAGRRSDAIVYGVVIGGAGVDTFLSDLSALSGGRLLNADSARNLQTAFLAILDEFRHRYLISYTPRAVSKAGWHRLDVRVKDRRAKVSARPGYFAGS